MFKTCQFRLFWSVLAVLLNLIIKPAGSCLAGPNAGGTLIVHYRAGAAVPAEPAFVDGNLSLCEDAVNQVPAGSEPVLWFVYAAFPPNASPRLKVVSWGVEYGADVAVQWGVPPLGSTEITAAGPNGPWPASGSGDLLGFWGVLTDTVDEIYTFAGYGYDGARFATVPHFDPGLGGVFVSDPMPAALEDAIAAFGTLGFGVAGENTCPGPAILGACCRGVDGSCELVPAASCIGVSDLYQGDGTTCPFSGSCTEELGACCFTAACVVQTYASCVDQGWLYQGFGTTCSPDPCPDGPLGACCHGGGAYACVVTLQSGCPYPFQWSYGMPCIPGFCAPGACCVPETGVCTLTTESQCEDVGNLYVGVPYCDPNPCRQPGACCDPTSGICIIRPEVSCQENGWWYMGDLVPCEPNPCPQPGQGACCLPSGECFEMTAGGCQGVQGIFMGIGVTCVPNPCSAVPVESTTWGRIKARYRG